MRDAPHIWKTHITSTLKSAGVKESEVMPCVYVNRARKVMLAAHVDDIIGTGDSKSLEWAVATLKSVYAIKVNYMGWNDDRKGTFLGRALR